MGWVGARGGREGEVGSGGECRAAWGGGGGGIGGGGDGVGGFIFFLDMLHATLTAGGAAEGVAPAWEVRFGHWGG